MTCFNSSQCFQFPVIIAGQVTGFLTSMFFHLVTYSGCWKHWGWPPRPVRRTWTMPLPRPSPRTTRRTGRRWQGATTVGMPWRPHGTCAARTGWELEAGDFKVPFRQPPFLRAPRVLLAHQESTNTIQNPHKSKNRQQKQEQTERNQKARVGSQKERPSLSEWQLKGCQHKCHIQASWENRWCWFQLVLR